MLYASAPKSYAPPSLFADYATVRGLGLQWTDLRIPLSRDEIALLAAMVGIWAEAQARRARVNTIRRR